MVTSELRCSGSECFGFRFIVFATMGFAGSDASCWVCCVLCCVACVMRRWIFSELCRLEVVVLVCFVCCALVGGWLARLLVFGVWFGSLVGGLLIL